MDDPGPGWDCGHYLRVGWFCDRDVVRKRCLSVGPSESTLLRKGSANPHAHAGCNDPGAGFVTPATPLSPPLWFFVESGADGGRRYRDYTIFDPAGEALAVARTFLMKRDIPVRSAIEPTTTRMLLRRRRSFPVTGRYDLFEDEGGVVIGRLSRSGRFRSVAGDVTGRFRDARTLKQHAGESAFELVGELLLGDGESSSAGSGPSGFVLLNGDRPVGTLTRERLPFAPRAEPARERGRVARTFGRIMPARVKAAAADMAAPRGWKLVIEEDNFPDTRLPVGAALLAIEIGRW
jgi:hypothetical protein